MECEVQIHEKTHKCSTWEFQSVDGWYLNTTPEHYHVHNCYVNDTSAECLSDTVHFKHKNISNPAFTPVDKLMLALAHCNTALAGVQHSSVDTHCKLSNDSAPPDQLLQVPLQQSAPPSSIDSAPPPPVLTVFLAPLQLPPLYHR
eukprot:CCRYP_010312-RA/>CCRYP_010312-RA protein AED:0.48 eAED:0.48 QI:0/0/0/1/0/0/2/0/144